MISTVIVIDTLVACYQNLIRDNLATLFKFEKYPLYRFSKLIIYLVTIHSLAGILSHITTTLCAHILFKGISLRQRWHQFISQWTTVMVTHWSLVRCMMTLGYNRAVTVGYSANEATPLRKKWIPLVQMPCLLASHNFLKCGLLHIGRTMVVDDLVAQDIDSGQDIVHREYSDFSTKRFIMPFMLHHTSICRLSFYEVWALCQILFQTSQTVVIMKPENPIACAMILFQL